MKTLLNIALIGVIVISMGCFAVQALDKSFYPGATIVEQNGKLLTVKLDDSLMSGADGACETAAKTVYKMVVDGYHVVVLKDESGWSPLPDQELTQAGMLSWLEDLAEM